MQTIIDDEELIEEILQLGYMVKNDLWTDCPFSVYIQLKMESLELQKALARGER
tara:strand:+ start:325 stop:486 length:162 start_codon:yes stop_codon:yes gene_type:complete